MIAALASTLLLAATLEGVTFAPSFDSSRWVEPRERIEIRFDRPVTERVAVFIGNRDVTPLFEVTSTSLRYRTGVPPLPSGEHEVILYSVPREGAWQEIARFPMKVLTRRGFEKATVKPSLDLTNKGQLQQEQNPAQSFGSRDQFQDVTAQGGLQGELSKGDFVFRTNANLTGVSYVNEALRFSQKGEHAPRVDLASYLFEVQKGPVSLQVGHVGFGSQRHLINGFSSRGAVLTFGAGRPVSLSFGAMNGTAIVGWDNFLGFHEQEHRMYSTTLGLELIRSRPGALRVEASILNGSLMPFDAFAQGSVRSAEKSRGGALRILASTPSQRFIVDGGWTRSRFTPRPDPQLEEGLPVTPLPDVERDAHYVDATFMLVQNKMIGSQSASLSTSVSFERVEPLFRSIAAYAQADIQRASASLNGSIGPFTMQLSHASIEDNLDDVQSILKTKTRQSSLNVGLSLATLFGARRGARWIPGLTAQVSRIHQYGAFLPVNAGFSESHVPDQVSLSAQAAIEWQIARTRFGVRGSLSDQDNRQPGRQLADFENDAGTLFFGFAPTDRFDVQLEGSLEEQNNIENATSDRNRRYGTTLTWRFFRDFAIAGNYSQNFGRDGARTNERRSSDAFVELSSGFGLWRNRAQQNRGRLFLRYANRDSRTFDRIFGLDTENDGWSLTSGVNMSVY